MGREILIEFLEDSALDVIVGNTFLGGKQYPVEDVQVFLKGDWAEIYLLDEDTNSHDYSSIRHIEFQDGGLFNTDEFFWKKVKVLG